MYATILLALSAVTVSDAEITAIIAQQIAIASLNKSVPPAQQVPAGGLNLSPPAGAGLAEKKATVAVQNCPTGTCYVQPKAQAKPQASQQVRQRRLLPWRR